MGCQLRGDLEHYVSSVDPCICYHHNDAMLSVGFKDYFTILRAALYAEPFVNVKDGINFQVHLMIWEKGIVNRKVVVESYEL